MRFSRSALPCSACSYLRIANVTELSKFKSKMILESTYLPLIKSLICSDSHHNLVSDTKQEKTSFREIEGNLTDNFIEALREKLFSHRADATLSCLTLHKLLVEHFSESRYIDSASRLVAHILDPVLS